MLQGLSVNVARTEIADYRPDEVISAVNALIPLGKEGALQAIQACQAILAPERETVG